MCKPNSKYSNSSLKQVLNMFDLQRHFIYHVSVRLCKSSVT